MSFKKLLLINLPGVEQSGYSPSPLGILYLASYIRNFSSETQVDIVDGAIKGALFTKNKILTFQPNIVGISVMTPSRLQAVSYARFIKKYFPKCKVVLGGIHPTLMWQQMMENYPEIDYIVKGEGEETLLELISKTKTSTIKGLVYRHQKKIINNPDRPFIKNLDKIPFPAWDLINITDYPARGTGIENGINLEEVVRVPIIFSRGCMGSCSFCSTWKIWKGYRFRSGKNVAAEVLLLAKKYNAKHFVFQDDTLTGNRQQIIDFCHRIINSQLKLAFFGCTRVDYVDLPLLKLMKKCGFYEISYGVESGSPSMLSRMNKKTDIVKIKEAAKATHKAKIKFCALMMSGLPTETAKEKNESIQLLQQIKPDEVGTLGEVWIFPGTALYYQAKAAKLIRDSFWLSPQPYYIYRGGIGGDRVNFKALITDWYQLRFKKNIQNIFHQQ